MTLRSPLGHFRHVRLPTQRPGWQNESTAFPESLKGTVARVARKALCDNGGLDGSSVAPVLQDRGSARPAYNEGEPQSRPLGSRPQRTSGIGIGVSARY